MADNPLAPTLYFSEARTPAPSMHAQVAFVEGSAPRQESDTERVLRKRLAAVTAVLGVGFAAYFVQDIITRQLVQNVSEHGGGVCKELWFCVFHGAVTVVLGAVYAVRMLRKDLPVRTLR